MRYLKTNTATIVTVGPFLDKTDGVTLETGLTITNERISFVVDLNNGSAPTLVLDNVTGATSGTSNDLNYITGCDAGLMQLELAAANVNYLGRAFLTVTDAANHCPVFHEFTILPAMVYDSLIAGTDVLQSDMTQILGTAVSTPASAGILDVNVKNIDDQTTSASGTITFPNDTLAGTTDTGDIQSRIPAALVSGRIDANVGAYGSAGVTPLLPTVAGRTLDVTTGGAAGIDWGNVENPTTTVSLSSTTVGVVSTVTALAANSVSASALATDAVAEIADGVWDEVLSGHLTAGTTGAALNASGSAGDPWSTALPGAYGAGTAGKLIGDNINAPIATVDTVVDAIKAKTDNLPTDPADQSAVEAAITAATSPLATAANLATVDTVVDSILVDTDDIQTRIPAALVSGRIDANVGAYGSAGVTPLMPTTAGRTLDVTATGAAGIDWGNVENPTTANTLSSTTVGVVSTVTALAANSVNASALATDAVTEIQSGLATAASIAALNNLSAAAAADAVWDEALSGHLTAGSTGEALNAAGAAGDPWTTTLPGSYTGSQAGKILADVLVDTGTTLQAELDGIQADTEDIQTRIPAALVSGRMDANVGAYGSAGVTPLFPTVAGRTLDVTTGGAAGIDWGNVENPTTTVSLSSTTVGVVSTVTALAANSVSASALATDAVAEIADGVWDEALSGHLTAGSTGEALNAAGAAGDPWTTTLPGSYTGSQAGAMLADILTDTGTTLQAELDGIQADTEDIQTRIPAALVSGRMDSVVGAYGSAGVTPLFPTVAGRTLDVTTGGAAGIDWGNVENPTTTVSLSSTTVGVVSTVTALAANSVSASALATDAVAEIADGVWDEAISGHLTAGSTGEALNAAGAAGDPWTTTLPGAYTGSQAGKVLADVLVDTGTTLQAELDGIQADTEDIQTRIPAALVSGRIDASVGAMEANALTAAALATDAVEGIADAVWDETASHHAISGTTGSRLTGANTYATSASAAAVAVNDTIQTMVEIDGAVWRYTTNALEQGPTGLSAAQVNAEVVDALNVDTYAEPGQGAPAATTSLAAKINYLYKAWRNRKTQTATAFTLYADNATTADQAATTSDDGTTFEQGEMGTGA